VEETLLVRDRVFGTKGMSSSVVSPQSAFGFSSQHIFKVFLFSFLSGDLYRKRGQKKHTFISTRATAL
jgi:hypothetical protein